MMSRRKSIPELRVVFDTSALYTDSESDLLRQEVVEAIRNNSKHADLQLKWYLPAIVVDERLFQMQNKGRKFLPHIQRLEKLLGHSLNINEEVINHQIRDVVERQIKELGLEILALEVNSVDWQRVMKDAVYRVPPFEAGETEKGFRDALICESVTQLVSNSPVTPNVCRIAFMTNDGLLAKAVKNRTETATNMRVLNSLEELKSLINTLVAAISEEFVARIQEKAKAYFFEPGNKDTFFYKEKIRGQIEEKFGNKLQILPQNATYRENGNWKIQPPTFLRKEKQRVYWASRIQVEAKAYKTTLSTLPISVFSSLPPTDISLYHVSGPAYIGPEHSGLASKSENIIVSGSIVSGLVPLSGGEERAIGRFGIPPRQELIANGETVFEVTWSISVTTTGKFSSPRIENIKFIETLWE
jgi:hypothetical protein